MTKTTTSVSKMEEEYSKELLTFNSSKSFDEVVSDFEKQLGRFDETRALSSRTEFAEYVGQTEGSSGLMIMATLEMGALPGLAASATRARQYLVGNPLIASKMASHDALAALHAPIRVLVYACNEKTCISYDKSSTTFGRLGSDAILVTAKDLDQKFEDLARKSLS